MGGGCKIVTLHQRDDLGAWKDQGNAVDARAEDHNKEGDSVQDEHFSG
jgi:hypothetical protein